MKIIIKHDTKDDYFYHVYCKSELSGNLFYLTTLFAEALYEIVGYENYKIIKNSSDETICTLNLNIGDTMGNMRTFWIFGFEWWGKMKPAEMTTADGKRFIPLVFGLWILSRKHNEI